MTKPSDLRFNSYSATHIGLKRPENQDAYGEADTRYGYAFVVCDGMGGHAGGAEAARIAVQSITDYLQNELQDSPIQALHEAIVNANRKIFERASVQPELKGMGSTCVVLLISNEGKAYLAHVGDSRIYGWQNGELIHLTKDHSFVQLMVDQGQIAEADAEKHPNRNQILRALGAEDEVRPTIAPKPIPLQSGMCFLLFTDGLNGMVSDKDIAESMSEAEVNDTLADMLISKALNGGGKDNVTLTIVEIAAAEHIGVELNSFDVRNTPKPVTADDSMDDKPDVPPNPDKPRLYKYIFLLIPILIAVVGYVAFRSGASEPTLEQPFPGLDTLASPVTEPVDTQNREDEVGSDMHPSISSTNVQISPADEEASTPKPTQPVERARPVPTQEQPESTPITQIEEAEHLEPEQQDQSPAVTDTTATPGPH